MDKLLEGLKKFQTLIYPLHQTRFEELAESQEPRVLFITCSDSRVDPNLLTQTDPGELFICRNAGNIVPPHSNETGGMTASIEYAVSVLNIKNIIICGHSNCGAMKAAMNTEELNDLPHVKTWLGHCRAAVKSVENQHDCNQHGTLDPAYLDEVTKQNIILQMQHIKTHPAVFAKLATNELNIYGWVYDIKSGNVEYYDEASHGFVKL
ncbi:MAG: carbonic anhydrase [Gammaproteobacteria bacterium]|nr:carbonic anhydrase [Gammaproteobacteria bacterium]